MTVSAHLAGIAAEHYEASASSALDIRRLIAEADARGFALVELDLPIGKLALPREIVDRAILARLTRGAHARPLLFVRGHKGGVVPVKFERALDREIALVERFDGPPLVAAAALALSELGPLGGKALLREARSRRGRSEQASTRDSADLAKAIVRAWNDGPCHATLTESLGAGGERAQEAELGAGRFAG